MEVARVFLIALNSFINPLGFGISTIHWSFVGLYLPKQKEEGGFSKMEIERDLRGEEKA